MTFDDALKEAIESTSLHQQNDEWVITTKDFVGNPIQLRRDFRVDAVALMRYAQIAIFMQKMFPNVHPATLVMSIMSALDTTNDDIGYLCKYHYDKFVRDEDEQNEQALTDEEMQQAKGENTH